MFNKTQYQQQQNALMNKPLDILMGPLSQQALMGAVPKFDYGRSKEYLSGAISAAGLAFPSSPKVELELTSLLAAAAEKRMIEEARIVAALRKQQDLLEQRKNDLLLRLLSKTKNNEQRQGNEPHSERGEVSCSHADKFKSTRNSIETVPRIIYCSSDLAVSDQEDNSTVDCSGESSTSNNNYEYDSMQGTDERDSLCNMQNSDEDEEHTEANVDSSDESTPSLQTEQSGARKRANKHQHQPVFTPEQEKKWNARFKEFVEFVRENGHGAVPHTYPQNKQLARWVRRQRQMYKLYQNGQPSAMNADRSSTLVSAGFIWDSHEVNWKLRVDALKRYREKHGDCNVSEKYNKKLGGWAKYLRRQYKLHMDGKQSSINAERIKELKKMGFDFQPLKKLQ